MRLLFFFLFRVSQPAQLTLDAAGQYRCADGRFASRTEIYAFQSAQPRVKEPTGPEDLVTLMTGIPPTNPAPAVEESSPQQPTAPAAPEEQLDFSPDMVTAIIATLKAAGISSPRTPTKTRAPCPKALEPVKFTGKGKPEENIRWLDTVTRYFASFGPWREDYIYILASYFVEDATKFGRELVIDFDAWKDSKYHSEYTPHRARSRSPFNDGNRLDRPNCAKNFTEFKERFEKLFVTVTPKEHAQKQLRKLTKTGANASITAFDQSFRLIAGRTGLSDKTLILFYEERIGSRIHELVTLMDNPKDLNDWMRRAEKVGLSLEKSAHFKKNEGLFAPPTQTVRTQAVRVPVPAPAAASAAGPLSQPHSCVDRTKVVCNKCNQLGHGWRRCPKNPGTATDGNTAKIRTVQVNGVSSMADDALKEQIRVLQREDAKRRKDQGKGKGRT
jgi:hypothetical protein